MLDNPEADSAAVARSQTRNIGARIRYMRRQRSVSLDQLAAAANVTKSYLSKVERGLSVPSISTVLKIAKSFGVSVAQLVGEEEDSGSICVVRKDERTPFVRDGVRSGYNYEMIGAGKQFRTLEPFIMTPPQSYRDDQFFEHPGEELVFVLSGTVEVEFPNRKVQLREGDTIYFDSHIPHRSRSLGRKLAKALVVVTKLP